MTGSNADSATVTNARVQRALGHWFGDEPCTYDLFGSGYINRTWRVNTGGGVYVLQNLSSEVFSDPRRVAANQATLFNALASAQAFNYQLPQPLPALGGELLINLGEQNPDYWRLSAYIDNTRTLQTLANPVQARAVGEAFGSFQRLARGVDPADLVPVIDGFLQLEGYWRSLSDVVQPAVQGHDSEAYGLWVELERLFADCQAETTKADAVIHGDCKVNNLLFAAERDAVVAILDLDTLMAAPWWLDFGDLVRSAVWDKAGEFQAEFYDALALGYFAGRGALRAAELNAALRAPLHLGFMLSVRFLDDHLRGDKYFRVARSGDNLRRAQDQLGQLKQLQGQLGVMRATLGAIVDG